MAQHFCMDGNSLTGCSHAQIASTLTTLIKAVGASDGHTDPACNSVRSSLRKLCVFKSVKPLNSACPCDCSASRVKQHTCVHALPKACTCTCCFAVLLHKCPPTGLQAISSEHFCYSTLNQLRSSRLQKPSPSSDQLPPRVTSLACRAAHQASHPFTPCNIPFFCPVYVLQLKDQPDSSRILSTL